MISLWVAAHAPERVERVVACCTTRAFRHRSRGGLPDAGRARARRRARADRRRGRQRWFTPGFARARPEVVSAAARRARGHPAGRLRRLLRGAGRARPAPGSRRASAHPRSCWPGRTMRPRRPTRAAAIAAAVPGARLTVLARGRPSGQCRAGRAGHRPGAGLLGVGIGGEDVVSDYETGMRTRREVLGDAHVDRATAAAGAFGQPFQEFITRLRLGRGVVAAGPGPAHAQRHHAGRACLRAGRERVGHARPRRSGQRPDGGGDRRDRLCTRPSTPGSRPPTPPLPSPGRRSAEEGALPEP